MRRRNDLDISQSPPAISRAATSPDRLDGRLGHTVGLLLRALPCIPSGNFASRRYVDVSRHRTELAVGRVYRARNWPS